MRFKPFVVVVLTKIEQKGKDRLELGHGKK
jgi:hypothetical protein